MRKLNLIISVSFFSLFIFSCSTMVSDMKKMEKKHFNESIYTINYFLEDKTNTTNPKKYIKDNSLTEVHTGKVGEVTQVFAKGIEGYKYNGVFVNQQVIKADKSTEVNLYYNLNRIFVSFDANYGYWGDDRNAVFVQKESGLYNHPLENKPADPSRSGYDFVGWEPEVPDKFPLTNTTYKAKWKKQKSAYKVVYEKQELYDASHYESEETEWKDARVDSTSTINPPILPGFMDPVYEQIVFKEDKNENIIHVRYTRKQFELTLDPNGGTWEWINDPSVKIFTSDEDTYGVVKSSTSPESSPIKIVGFEGAEISKVIFGHENFEKTSVSYLPSLQDKKVDGWINSKNEKCETPLILPISSRGETNTSCTLTADWVDGDAEYKVRFVYEKSDSTDSEVFENYETLSYHPDVILSGRINSEVTYDSNDCPRPDEGFDSPKVLPAIVKADKSAIVYVMYPRSIVHISFNLNGGNCNGQTTFAPLSGKSQSDVSSELYPENPVLEDYEFLGWAMDDENNPVEALPAKFPKSNVAYVAVWKRTKQRYLIKLYEEDINGGKILKDTYEKYSSEEAEVSGKYITGSVGSLTNVNSQEVGDKWTIKAEGYKVLDVVKREGFEIEIENVTVSEKSDELSIVNVTEKRKEITYVFNPNNGIWISGNKKDTSEPLILKGLYGQSLGDAIGKVTRENWTYWSWVKTSDLNNDNAEAVKKLPQTFGYADLDDSDFDDEDFKAKDFRAKDLDFSVKWYSNIIGRHINTTDKDIKLVVTSRDEQNHSVVLEVDLPYTGNWSFVWYDGASVISGETGKSVVLSGAGKHSIRLFATETDTGLTGITNEFTVVDTVVVK